MPERKKRQSASLGNATKGESGTVFYEAGKKYNYRNANGKPYFRATCTIAGKQRSVYGDGEKDARRRIEELKAQADAGIDLDRNKSKVGDTFRAWLFDVKRVDKDLKASSFARYECTYRTHIAPYPIAQRTLSKLDSGTMQKYVTALYDESGCSTSSVKNTVKVWRMFTKWAVEEGLVAKDPCRNLSIPGKREKGQKRKIEVFTAQERQKLLAYMDESRYEYDTLVKLAFATGMRQGELLGLMWKDVGKDRITVERSTAIVTHVDKDGNRSRQREVWDPKTESSARSIPLLPETVQMLADHRAKQARFFNSRGIPLPLYVFTTLNGKLIDGTSFAKSWRRLLVRAGVEYKNFHCIRHTFATEALRSGVPISDVQALLGHANMETTMIYISHSDDNAKEQAILRMGSLI